MSVDMRDGKSIAYRPDIDGLRAIAIISVVAYHAAPELFRGGFIGVDVFFVISGFLISSIVFRELDNRTFILMRFYARRIRRLFPALALVLAATAFIGWYYLLPHEFRALGAQIASGAAYIINFTLEKQAGYFDAAAGEKPLLHLWSLAIEEQFYIFYPALLLLVRPRGRWWTFGFLAATTIVSATLNIVEAPRNEAAAFYLPQNRFWELSAGGLLAFGEAYVAQSASGILRRFLRLGALPPNMLRNLLSLAGLGLVLGSSVGFNAAIVYPGAWALIPCFGALLLIGAGAKSLVNRWLLSNPLAVGIGLISYPVYLWHWPLLSFANILGVAGDWRIRLAAVAAAVGLAGVTYLAIEKPLPRIAGRRLPAGLFAVMWALCLVGASFSESIVKPRLDEKRFQDIGNAIADFEYPIGLRKERAPSGLSFNFAGQGAEKTMYLGDSNIEQYWPRIEWLLNNESNRKSVVFATAGGCPPIAGVHSAHLPRCNGFAEKASDLAFQLGVSTVVIGADWRLYFNDSLYYVEGDSGGLAPGSPASQHAFDNLSSMIQALRDHGVSVWIILNIPTGPELAPLAGLRRSWTGDATLTPTHLDRLQFDLSWTPIRAKLTEIAKATGSSIVDPMEWLCNSTACPSMTADGIPIYKDAEHLRSSFVRDHAVFIDRTFLGDAASPTRN